MSDDVSVDICIISEGAYPYVSGGVAAWLHELINDLPEKTFHILTLMPPESKRTFRYTFPKNVIGHTVYTLQGLPEGADSLQAPKETWKVVEQTFKGLISSPHFENFGPLLQFIQKYRQKLGKKIFSESQEMWESFLKLYNEMLPTGPFKSYFNTAYVLCASLFSILLPELPRAKMYHALCTGYAGFCLYKAKQESNAPCLLTEHGIYSNERRIEIAMAEWISDYSSLNLALDGKKMTLKDFWLNAFLSMAYVCYRSCDEIISIFDGNDELQITGGAEVSKMRTIIPGIDPELYGGIPKKVRDDAPVIAFVGRVVPIKDVKTFIRACQLVKQALPKASFYAIGPTEEDPEYFSECRRLVAFLGLEESLSFLGKVDMKQYYPEIDLVVLTSISEALPRIIMEAGAIGIPFVATNVGACSQLCYGAKKESPSFGQGGIITALANPQETALAIIKLLTDKELYEQCSHAMTKRVHTSYRADHQIAAYRELYNKYLD